MQDLDSIISAMYRAVSYDAGSHPDWDLETQIYAPNARLVRINDNGVFEFDLASFRTNFEQMIASGELPSFWEGEIWRETRIFGEMAHVLSAYETRKTQSAPVINRGVNSIQLFRRDARWWISAMIWRREGRDVRIGNEPPAA